MKEIHLDATYHSHQDDGEITFSIYDRSYGCSRCSYYEVVINNHEYDKYCVACVDSEYKIIPSGETRDFEVDRDRQSIKYDIYDTSNMTIQEVIESVRYLIPDGVLELFREFDQFKSLTED
jgi:hypothetical protein